MSEVLQTQTKTRDANVTDGNWAPFHPEWAAGTRLRQHKVLLNSVPDSETGTTHLGVILHLFPILAGGELQ